MSYTANNKTNKAVVNTAVVEDENTYTWQARDPRSGKMIDFKFKTPLNGNEDKFLRMIVSDWIQLPKLGEDFFLYEMELGRGHGVNTLYGHAYPDDIVKEVKRVLTSQYAHFNTLEYLGRDAKPGQYQ